MSETGDIKTTTPKKQSIKHDDYKDQSKVDKHSSNQEQASSQAVSKAPHHSSTVTKENAGRGRLESEHSEKSSHKSAIRKGSRKSLASDGNRTLNFSAANDESLLNNKKTYNILQNDKVLLSNRIVMLKKEEEKLMKKIQGTREKALKISEIMQRNEERFNKKIEDEELEKLRVEQEREKLRQQREQRKEEFERQRLLMLENKKQVYQDYRHQKAFAVKHKSKVRMNVVKQNKIKRDRVREEELRIQEKLRQREEEKRKRNQLHYSMKVEYQKYHIGKIDTEISAMEREEKEILERLKNSQRMEQEAYKSLENAIKKSVDSTEFRKQMQSNLQSSKYK